jgi:hypothetical protein
MPHWGWGLSGGSTRSVHAGGLIEDISISRIMEPRFLTSEKRITGAGEVDQVVECLPGKEENYK